MDLNTATFEEMQSLTGIGHGRAQAIFDVRANLSRPLTLLDLLEMGIPADVVKSLVDDLKSRPYIVTKKKMKELTYNRCLLLLWHHCRGFPVM